MNPRASSSRPSDWPDPFETGQGYRQINPPHQWPLNGEFHERSSKPMTKGRIDDGGFEERHWDGVTLSETLTDEGVKERGHLVDLAKHCDWPRLVTVLKKNPRLMNISRPDGQAKYAPLHHAAYGGAPRNIVERLIDLGAFRTLRNSKGERPVDIARERSHLHLLTILEPVTRRRVNLETLGRIQARFHEVICGRAYNLVVKHSLRLPELEILLEFDKAKCWFAVPGMYGGFAFWLAEDRPEPKLICESWCRVVGGSGQRHEITRHDARLTAEGFV
jgi:hypothetical protein